MAEPEPLAVIEPVFVIEFAAGVVGIIMAVAVADVEEHFRIVAFVVVPKVAGVRS